jgi:hypothetical protein
VVTSLFSTSDQIAKRPTGKCLRIKGQSELPKHLFFLHLETRRAPVAGMTRHPTEEWMVQMARKAGDAVDGPLLSVRFALHDRGAKFCTLFHSLLQSSGVEPIRLRQRSPNLNAFQERFVRFIKADVYPSSSSLLNSR